MTNAELDLLWAQATVEAIENGEMYTRHRFAAAVLSRQLAEIERLRDELEAISAANSKILEENKELAVAVIKLLLELEALRKQEPVASIDIWHNHGLENTNVDYWGSLPEGSHMLYLASGAQPAPSVPDCPYPCGWKNLLTIALQDGAFLARAVEEGEVVTESIRATTMKVVLNLREVLLAINKAPAAPEAPESAPSVPEVTAMVDAAMEATQHIHPPITRSQCKLIIEAAFAAAPKAPKRKPLTDAMVEAAGRALSDRHANGCGCGMDKDIMWGSYSDEFKAQARVALEAAQGTKESDND